ncbi:hypothetical protein [Schaalia sp. JY-X169]|uniref:hypothetical protein n=1 Tax=Schaalia sp. JY-X169 TaxID=2758572 RepID=UPI0015F6B72F|nr:hypothetical protein [Schaalia sp. JY-X169]
MAFKFSPETKRSVLIVVAAGLIIALASGTWAMFGQIFGDKDASSTTASEVGLATPEGPVPAEVTEWFMDDLGNLGQPFPEGAGTPEVPDLLPQVKGSKFISGDKTSITIEIPENYVDPEAEDGVMTYAVYRRGDISVLEALLWRCDWAEAYIDAETADDAAGAATARGHIEGFSELQAVQGLPVARQNEEEMAPVLDGDTDSARGWLKEKCGR